MKFQYLLGKYIFFVLVAVSSVHFHPTSAYPHLRAKREPGGVRVSYWRRQAPVTTSKLAADLLKYVEKELNNSNDCGNCTALKEEITKLKVPETQHLRPAYECDRWDNVSRTCWLDRNIGDTVTFVLNFAEGANPQVQWRQEFHVMHAKERRQFDIDPENPMWNVVIGSRGHEMRLSPITEIDVDSNRFTALVVRKNKPLEKTLETNIVSFRIRVMPVDQGFVYPGETLVLNMRSVDLPPRSMQFKWYLERKGKGGEERSLPSNMKVSPSGAVLTIWELRREQEGVMACTVYTNLGILATKKRFLINETIKNNNQLLFEPTRPSTPNRQKRALNPDENLKWAYRIPKNNDIYYEDDVIPEDRKNEERSLRPLHLPHKNGVHTSGNTDSEDPRYEDHPNVDPKRQSKPFRLPKYKGMDTTDNTGSVSEDPNTDDRPSRSFPLPQNGVYKSYDKDSKLKDQMTDNRHSRSNNEQDEMKDEYDYDSQDDDKIGRREILDRQSVDDSSMQDDSDQQDFLHGNNKGGDKDQPPNFRRQADSKQVAVDILRDQVHKNTQDDYSRMISTCEGDLQCSSDAECVQPDPERATFCRCKSGYQGNGIFCWEENQAKTSAEAEERQLSENRVQTPELRVEPPNED